MRSLLLAAIRPLVIRIGDGAVHRKMRKRQQRKEKWQAEGRATWNARLPPARSTEKDSLDVGGRGGGVDVSTQQQSPFFTKLPLEIRRLIYTYALGGEQLELELVDEILDEKRYKRAPFRLKCPSAQRLLAFPKSCKMVYMEAVQFIYTSNTFLIPDITAYFCFQRLLPTYFFQAIQSVHLTWAHPEAREMFNFLDGIPPYDVSSWKQTWQEISKMKGLKYVRVNMVINAPYVIAEYEELLFSPLAAVQGVEEIEVYVSWEEHGQADEEGRGRVWPFTLRRGVESLAWVRCERGLGWQPGWKVVVNFKEAEG